MQKTQIEMLLEAVHVDIRKAMMLLHLWLPRVSLLVSFWFLWWTVSWRFPSTVPILLDFVAFASICGTKLEKENYNSASVNSKLRSRPEVPGQICLPVRSMDSFILLVFRSRWFLNLFILKKPLWPILHCTDWPCAKRSWACWATNMLCRCSTSTCTVKRARKWCFLHTLKLFKSTWRAFRLSSNMNVSYEAHFCHLFC